ncbi:hypothetical protein MRB53_037243 [Persea americana]|nr:hypothetical protein MRB53_037243 [Persea americana]
MHIDLQHSNISEHSAYSTNSNRNDLPLQRWYPGQSLALHAALEYVIRPFFQASRTDTAKLELVRQLSASESNTIFALVRDPKSSPKLIKLAEKSNVHIIPGDLNSLSQLQAAAKSVSEITGGSLDILINNGAYLDTANAAIPPSQLTEPDHLQTFLDAMNKSVDTNVIGAIYVTNSFLPLIEQGKEKKIVHISTGNGDTDIVIGSGTAALLPYSASKAMLNNVVAKYGVELQPKGIHVVGISPGFVNNHDYTPEMLEYLLSMFRKIQPDATAITEETSVRLQLQVISKLGWEVQGRMISQHGNQRWF